MPLPGGEADKLGNRYEGRWTVFCMIDILNEKAESIRLEKLGEDAFEFFLYRDRQLEGHQVKRQKSRGGSWTLKALQNKQYQILSDFWQNLKNSDGTCVFVSSQSANELRELADRARATESCSEFKRWCLSQELTENFETLQSMWSCDEEAAYEALRRIFVETISDHLLTSIVESRLAALVEGDPRIIRLELAELASERIHHKLTAYDIWHYLSTIRGYQRREWNKDPHVLAAVDYANEIYRNTWHDAKIAGRVLPRDEASAVLQHLNTETGKRHILLVGEAGVGKSGVTLQVLDALHQQGIPYLAFRVDRLEPTMLPATAGQQLGLPSSPAIVLANIAQQRKCVLVIDQLDAVSLASGRNPGFFDCITTLIAETQAHPNVHLLLVCRNFDLENDHRLRGLTGKDGNTEVIKVEQLSSSIVKEVVAGVGLEVTALNDKQIRLLSIPAHLHLLAEVAENATTDVLNFETARDLYDQFWEYKQQKLRERVGHAVQWSQIVDMLCNYMSDKQVLSAPEQLFDAYPGDAKAMASEHVLIWENRRISFFHEGFFDYAFARRFAVCNQSLIALLKNSEQHLFRRAQVRQILLHKRDADFEDYLISLREILADLDIRFHLKQVAFALLGSLSDPQEDEWNIIAPFIESPHEFLAEKVWIILQGSVNWFQLVDRLGFIEQWLRSQQEELINKTLVLLSIMQNQLPERVAELIEPFVGISDIWSRRLVHILKFVKLDAGRRFFDLFLNLINTAVLDHVDSVAGTGSDRGFWSLIYNLPEQKPDWACEAIGCYLNHRLDLSLARGQNNPFDQTSGTIFGNVYHTEILKIARLAPESFINNVLPFMMRVMEVTAQQEDEQPWQDQVWSFRTYGIGHSIEDELLQCMETAFSELAVNHPRGFTSVVEAYFRDSPYETLQYLLIRAYTANGQLFANEAIDYLLQNPARLKTGYSICAGNSRNASYWATRQLVEAATLYCSPDRLACLEALILDYYPTWERRAEYRRWRGYAQFVLLDAISSSRRSNIVHRRLQELQRKFISAELLESPGRVEPPTSIEAHLVGPPIPQTAAERMTDEQWLEAIAQYQYDDADSRFRSNGEVVGGARQLSQFLLKKQVEKEPLRFARLIHSFPEDANVSYFNAVLNGIAEVGVDVQTALDVCQRCHQLPQQPCGSAICRVIENLADLPWSQEAFDLLTWYALNDPDPEQELWRTEAQNGQFYYGGNILTAGINSVRGNAATTIAKLILAEESRTVYFLDALREMVQDPSIAVRACVAEALAAVLNYDRDIAVSLFLELCETEDPLLGTKPVEWFLYYALQTHFEHLKPLLDRMLVSHSSEAIRVGARQACLASLSIDEAAPLASSCLSGTKVHRLAAAEFFVANLRSAHFQEVCENSLIQLFYDEDAEVRKEASKCFFHFEEDLGNYIRLVDEFIQSPSFANGSRDLIQSLEKMVAKLPESAYLICDCFVTNLLEEYAQANRSAYRDATSISQLLIKLYSQSAQNLALQSQCLDLIDRMTEIGVYGLDQAIEPYER